MTWYEEMRALGTINGRDVDANQQKYDKEDSDRIAKTRTEGDYFCDRFQEITDMQNKQDRKLSMLISGRHLFTGDGVKISDGALALFTPKIKNKPNENAIGWMLYMVANDGKAYLIGNGDKLELPSPRGE